MNAADAAVVRNVRRELSRRPIESVRIDVQSINGHVTLTGTMTKLRNQPGVNLEGEVETVTKIIMRDRGVKDVTSQVRLRELEDVPNDDKDNRGRLRR